MKMKRVTFENNVLRFFERCMNNQCCPIKVDCVFNKIKTGDITKFVLLPLSKDLYTDININTIKYCFSLTYTYFNKNINRCDTDSIYFEFLDLSKN